MVCCVLWLVAQLFLTLCDFMDCSPPGSSVHGILQARISEWVAVSFSRGTSQPRDQSQVSHIAGRFFTVWATREAHKWCGVAGKQRKTKKTSRSYSNLYVHLWASLVAQWYRVCLPVQETGFNPLVGKIPWRWKWQPTPVFLPGKSHGWEAWWATVHEVAKEWDLT